MLCITNTNFLPITMISKIKKIGLVIAICSLMFSPFMISSSVEAQDPLVESLLIANAGPDRFVKVGSEVIFDASSSSIPSSVEAIYRWDMGNSEFRFGMRNIYIYDQVGVFRVKLTIEGKNTEFKSVDEVIIHVFDKQLMLFSSQNSSSKNQVKRIEAIATENNIAVDSIRIEDTFPSQISLKQSFTEKMIAKQEDVLRAQMIVVLGDEALESFLAYYKRFSNHFGDKKFIFLTTEKYFTKPRLDLAQLAENVLGFSTMRVSNIETLDMSLFDFDSEEFSGNEFFKKRNRYHLGSLDFLFRFNTSLVEKGFSLDIVYFLYVMLLISIFGLFLRKILGLSVVAVHILGLTIFSFIIIGIVPAIILFTGFFIVSLLVQKVYETDKETLFSGNFIDMVMIVFFIVIGLSIIEVFVPTISFDLRNFMSILVIAIATRRLARYTAAMTIPRVMIHFIQDIAFLTINYFLLSASMVRLYVVGYPEIFVFVVLLLAVLLERYGGLRILEVVRFRTLLKKDYYSTDDQE